MSPERISGILMIIGSLAFMAAASPIGGEVYGETDHRRQMEIISSNRRGWSFSQFLFAISSLVVAFGFLIYATTFQAPRLRLFFLTSAILQAAGAAVWSSHVAWRAIHPERVLARYGTVSIEFLSFVTFGLLTIIALALFGIGVLQQGDTVWLGYVILGLTTLLAIQMVVFRGGFIPLLFYFPTLIVGVVFIL